MTCDEKVTKMKHQVAGGVKIEKENEMTYADRTAELKQDVTEVISAYRWAVDGDSDGISIHWAVDKIHERYFKFFEKEKERFWYEAAQH